MSGAFNLSEWALRHRTLVWFLMILVLVAGASAYMRLGRAEDPPFTFKIMVIQVLWPGATISDTLEQVTDRIERKLQETPGLDHVKSFTTPGRAMIYVVLRGDVREGDVAEAWYQVRKKVSDIRAQLPQGISGPFFNDEFGDTYGIIYAFTSDGFTQRELRDRVEEIRSRLLNIENVSKVDIFGAQDEKIYIEFSVERLAHLKLDWEALMRALQAQNAVTPAGVIQGADDKILVQVGGAFRSEEDLREVNFAANGHLIRLRDIATVERAYVDPPQPMFRFNGQPAIGLGIAMVAGGDILKLGENVSRAMKAIIAGSPVGIEMHLVADQPHVVEEAVGEFTKALWEAVAIVLAISFVSLGLRAGAVVACTIPLVLAAVFVAMDFFGIDLQRISLGALIIALGLLVDDAMITVEAMVTRLERGWDKVRSATYAYSTTAFPMLTGTLVTVFGFVPVGLARSAAGEYTFSLFAVVSIALMISWVVAVVFAPLIGVTILPDKFKHDGAEAGGRVSRVYRWVVAAAMRWRWATIVLTLALMGVAVMGMRFVSQQFFPASDRPELLVDLKLSTASSLYATERTVRQLDGLLKDNPEIDHWSTYVGSGAARFYLPLNVEAPNDFFAQTVIVTKSLEARERVRARLEETLTQEIPQAVVRLSPLELGPPIGWPLQYRVAGPDLDRVQQLGFQAAEIIAAHPLTRKVNFDWMEPVRTQRIVVDQDQARLLGVSSEQLATSLNAVVSGLTITQVRDEIYLIDVVARAELEARLSPEILLTLPIPLPSGGTAPLLQLAKVEQGQDDSLIWRRQRVPTLTIQSDITGGGLPEEVSRELQPQIDALNAGLEPGYSVVVGGGIEEARQSRASVAAVLPLAGMLMLVVLMIQLHSFQRVFLVLSVAPFGLVGVVAALLFSGKPLGFVALLGVIALIGMIIRNSVILVDQIRAETEHGHEPWDAVIEASVSRFRPILLTAAAAILAMIPIAPTVFWGPMAYAIMGGLAVATGLTLLFLPALYVTWFRIPRAACGGRESALKEIRTESADAGGSFAPAPAMSEPASDRSLQPIPFGDSSRFG
jgi:multidrug efflux pump subunit AcrB